MILCSTRATTSALRRSLAPASAAPARKLFARAQQQHGPPQQPQQEQRADEQQAPAGSAPEEGGGVMAMGPSGPVARGAGASPPASDMLLPTPFRRMADSMLQMQREMDSLMSAFGFPADPWAATDVFDRALAPLTDRSRLPGAMGTMGLLPRTLSGFGVAGSGRLMPFDVEEDDKGYTVTAEVPGFDKSEIKITLDDAKGTLTMAGTHQEEATEAGPQVSTDTPAGKATATTSPPSLRSRKYASFVRSLSLPEDAAAEGITATTEHGLLTVRIPKREQPAQRLREIPVA